MHICITTTWKCSLNGHSMLSTSSFCSISQIVNPNDWHIYHYYFTFLHIKLLLIAQTEASQTMLDRRHSRFCQKYKWLCVFMRSVTSQSAMNLQTAAVILAQSSLCSALTCDVMPYSPACSALRQTVYVCQSLLIIRITKITKSASINQKQRS